MSASMKNTLLGGWPLVASWDDASLEGYSKYVGQEIEVLSQNQTPYQNHLQPGCYLLLSRIQHRLQKIMA